MTISEMHTRVKQHNNTVQAPRFPYDQIDRALNSAIDMIVDEIYDPQETKDKDRAFQAYQRARDQLYTLIEIEPALTAVSNILPVYTLTGYRYLLELTVMISGKVYATFPTNYDEESVKLKKDPYSKPTLNDPELVYRNEQHDGVRILWGEIGTLQSGRVVYLKHPAVVNYNTSVDCDLPTVLHERICKLASDLLLAQVKDLTKP